MDEEDARSGAVDEDEEDSASAEDDDPRDEDYIPGAVPRRGLRRDERAGAADVTCDLGTLDGASLATGTLDGASLAMPSAGERDDGGGSMVPGLRVCSLPERCRVSAAAFDPRVAPAPQARAVLGNVERLRRCQSLPAQVSLGGVRSALCLDSRAPSLSPFTLAGATGARPREAIAAAARLPQPLPAQASAPAPPDDVHRMLLAMRPKKKT